MIPAPTLTGGERVGQYGPGQRYDEAAAFGKSNEHVRRDRTARRMTPTCQRLETDHLSVGQGDLRLERGDDLVPVEGILQLFGRR